MTAVAWLLKAEAALQEADYARAKQLALSMAKFCAKYGLVELKFKAELAIVDAYLAVRDEGQAMV